jgi:Na+/melibiose symporter-like transporter
MAAAGVLETRSDIAPPTALGSVTRLRIILYFGGLLVLMGFPESVINIPISFFLKNKLHLAAHQLAIFGLLAAIPAYFAVLFGFARDVWSPFGRGDRGFVMSFGALGAGLCAGFAFAPPVYATFLAAALVLSACFLFIRSALRGLIGTIGQQQAMSGQVSAAVSAFETIPAVVGLMAGGLLSSLLEGDKAASGAHILFLIGGGILAVIALYGVLKPRAVFDNIRREREAGAPLIDDLKRLVRHAPIYPALLIWLLWQFVPGLGTPLQYFLQDTLTFSDAQYGIWFALYFVGGVPGFILYGYLCQRFTLRTLLIGGTLLALPMMLPLLIIHQKIAAMAVAGMMGAFGGLAGAAFFDLIIRSCPKGLQGSMLMAASGALAVDGQLGNLFGTALYDHFHNFTVCVVAMTVTNALILPAILLVPRHLIANPDGVAAPVAPDLGEPEPVIVPAI